MATQLNNLLKKAVSSKSVTYYSMVIYLKEELDEFDHIITTHTMLHEAMKRFYSGFRRDAHPMATMVGVVGALSAFYHHG